jgi:hypothetical protein
LINSRIVISIAVAIALFYVASGAARYVHEIAAHSEELCLEGMHDDHADSHGDGSHSGSSHSHDDHQRCATCLALHSLGRAILLLFVAASLGALLRIVRRAMPSRQVLASVRPFWLLSAPPCGPPAA